MMTLQELYRNIRSAIGGYCGHPYVEGRSGCDCDRILTDVWTQVVLYDTQHRKADPPPINTES